jgi:hypothetical protein
MSRHPSWTVNDDSDPIGFDANFKLANFERAPVISRGVRVIPNGPLVDSVLSCEHVAIFGTLVGTEVVYWVCK